MTIVPNSPVSDCVGLPLIFINGHVICCFLASEKAGSDLTSGI